MTESKKIIVLIIILSLLGFSAYYFWDEINGKKKIVNPKVLTNNEFYSYKLYAQKMGLPIPDTNVIELSDYQDFKNYSIKNGLIPSEDY